MNNPVNLLTPSQLLYKKILSNRAEELLPAEECMDLITDHFSKWNIEQIIPNDSEYWAIQELCSLVNGFVFKMSQKNIDLVNDFYSRSFTRVLKAQPPNSPWIRSCVDPLFKILTKEVKLTQGKLILERLDDEGCAFNLIALIEGVASREDLERIVDHIYKRQQHEFLPYIALFAGNGRLAEICSTKRGCQWMKALDLDLIEDRASIAQCLKNLKGQDRSKDKETFLELIKMKLCWKPEASRKEIITNIALATEDDWIIHELFTAFQINTEVPRSLFKAALDGNTAHVKALMEKNIDLSARCDSDFTPLHYAALRNDRELVELLVNAKGDISSLGGPVISTQSFEKRPEMSNPVLLAAWYANESALHAFIECLPPDPDKIIDRYNAFGFSARYCAYANNLACFSDRFPPTELEKEIYRAKLLAHANGIAGDLSVGDLEIPLEGGLAYGMYREIANSLEGFLPHEGMPGEIVAEIVTAMQDASRPRSPEEILERIAEGKLTIIPTGYHHHYRAIVIYKERSLIIDGAAPFSVSTEPIVSPPTLADVRRILSDQIQTKRSNASSFNQNHRTFIDRPPRNQSVGNCSYYAPKHAFRQALALLLGDAEQARRIAKKWSVHFRMNQLESYICAHLPENNPAYPPNDDLIHRSFGKIYNHIMRLPEAIRAAFLEKYNSLVEFRIKNVQELHPFEHI